MKKIVFNTLIICSLLIASPSYSIVSAPRIIPCIYKINNSEDTASCIVDSAMNMGEMIIDVKVAGRRFRWDSASNNYFELLDKNFNTIQTYRGKIQENVQCQPGSFEKADRWHFSNGDYICLYYPD